MEWLDSRIYGPPIANYLTWDGGALSLEYSGKISWIYYSSEYETQERERFVMPLGKSKDRMPTNLT